MKTLELTVTRVGNSRGVRQPADVLRRCRIGDKVIMEQRPDEIALRPKRGGKLTWEETAKAMASANEDWSDWDYTVADGSVSLRACLKTRSSRRKEAQISSHARSSRRDLSLLTSAATEHGVFKHALNRALETVVVCPLTTKLHPDWRSRIQVKVAGNLAEVAVDQVRVVSKTRLKKRLATLSDEEAAALRRLLNEMYGER
jgi:mRNA interferase MazF